MNEIIQFRCMLPPPSGGIPPTGITAGAAPAPGSNTTPDGMIMHTLGPFRDELNAALVRDDRNAALTLAYTALSRISDALAACQGTKLPPTQVRVHALLVELEILPLEPLPDGTVFERGTAVTVNYRTWVVDRDVAAVWAQTLTEQFRTLWPGAWIVIGANG